MSEECTHNCETCQMGCGQGEREADFSANLSKESRVGHVYAVMSGKGGVGKSLVTGMLAAEFQKKGKKTAILDADITGPSIPKAFGLEGRRMEVNREGTLMLPQETKTGIQIASSNLLLDNSTDPIIWRGALIASCVTQFWSEVLWKDVDYMFVDMPPGTGDVPLTVFQSLPVDGIIVVTSPQDLVSMIVKKALNMAKTMNIPVIGIIENMSYYECPNCHTKEYIFGQSHIDDIAAQSKVRVLAKLPINPQTAKLIDEGKAEEIDTSPLSAAAEEMIKMDEALDDLKERLNGSIEKIKK